MPPAAPPPPTLRRPRAEQALRQNARDMAKQRRRASFLNYSDGDNRSVSEQTKSREHAKQLATAVATSPDLFPSSSGSSFADFGAAFGSLEAVPAAAPPMTMAVPTEDSLAIRTSRTSSASSSRRNVPRQPPVSAFVGSDPFANDAVSSPRPTRASPPPPSSSGMPQQRRQHESRTAVPPSKRTQGPSRRHDVNVSVGDFAVDWPDESTPTPPNMKTMPSNSTFQSSWAASRHGVHTTGIGGGTSRRQTQGSQSSAQFSSPLHHSSGHADVSYSAAGSSTAGAVARRKKRYEQKHDEASTAHTASTSTSASWQTPPPSPHMRPRTNQSAANVMTSPDHQTQRNHVANYTNHQRSTNVSHSNLNVSHRSMNGGSVASSTSSSNGMDGKLNGSSHVPDTSLFDCHVGSGGFTFDAFGLDASQLHREVSEAMNDIATLPDLSFFVGADDDFANGQQWESVNDSMQGSTTSNTSVARLEEDDGFVDGFKVASTSSSARKSSKTAAAFDNGFSYHTSPLLDGSASGRRLALATTASPAIHRATDARPEPRQLSLVGTAGRTPPPPQHHKSPMSRPRSFGSPLAAAPKSRPVMLMPQLPPEDAFTFTSPTRHRAIARSSTAAAAAINLSRDNVEFVDMDEASSSSSSSSSESDTDKARSRLDVVGVRANALARPEQLPQRATPTSDVNYASDVGVNSDVTPSSRPASSSSEGSAKVHKVPGNIRQDKDHSLRHQHEEKKDEEAISRSPRKTFGRLRAQFEAKDQQGDNAETEKAAPARNGLSRESIDKIQSQLGHEILSPEKLEQRRLHARNSNLAGSYTPAPPITSRPTNISGARSPDRSSKSLSSIRPSGQHRYAQSDVGATSTLPTYASHVMKKAASPRTVPSPRHDDRAAKSDAGAPLAFYGVKLRKTRSSLEQAQAAFAGRKTKIGSQQDGASSSPVVDDLSNEDLDAVPETTPVHVLAVPEPPTMTYRERREMELQQQRLEQERQRAEEAARASQPDVAALIKRRIAANKERESAVQTAEPAAPEQPDYIGVLKSRSNMSDDVSENLQDEEAASLPRQQPKSRPLPRSQSAAQTPQRHTLSELVIAESPSHQKAAPNPAVSHMMMLQQLQERVRVTETSPLSEGSPELPAPKNMSKLEHKLAVETRDRIISRSIAEESTPKGTPKATLIMLNAFLAGRESMSAYGPGSMAGQSQSEDIVFEGDSPPRKGSAGSSPTGAGAPGLPALKDDPKYEKYFKMLKVGMPLDVVKHAMTRDNLDPSIMDGDHNKPVGVPLKNDPTYSKYFKMLSIGLPMEAVKHAMERDGLPSSIMDQDHNLPVANSAATTTTAEPQEKETHRRARLHWKTLRKVTSNSLWAQIDQDDELDNIEIDEDEFQELFQVEKGADAAPKSAGGKQESRATAVRVIDPKRANNGGIVLARLKMSHDDMADAVDRINEHAMTAEQIENVIEYLPTKEERKALESYMLAGGRDAAEKFEGLCECEKFMVSMMTVKHAKRKVRALLFKLQFESCLQDIHNDTAAVDIACDQLRSSSRLRKLLGIVLTFGNRLNTAGNKNRKAGAFTLDSLLKLNQAKAFDKKTTFLQYIVLIVQRNNEILLNFRDDLPDVFKADKIFWDQCVTDLEEVENQLENVRRIALYQARQSRAYRLRRRKQKDGDDEESLSDGDVSLSLEEEVEALRATPIGVFTLSAIKYVSSLRDKVEATKAKYARLLEYFGEEDKKYQPHELFAVINAFSRDFEKAKDDVFSGQKRKKREDRKSKAGATTPHQQHVPSNYRREPRLMASNMQPNMGNVLKELATRVPTPGLESPYKHRREEQRARQLEREQSNHRAAFDDDYGGRHIVNESHYDGSLQYSEVEDSSPCQLQDIISIGSPTESSQQSGSVSGRVGHVTSSTKAAMREKARMRRQRNSAARASTSPPSLSSAEPSLSSRRSMDEEDDAGAQPLSPRSNMRQRRRQQQQRQIPEHEFYGE